MAINDIVQTIAEARVDARSLSEFVFKPASFMVARRLAPSVHTLQYYVNRFETIDSSFTQALNTANAAAVTATNNAVGLINNVTNQASQAVQNAIEGVAIDANLINDALTTTVPIVSGAAVRTQMVKNRESVSIFDFFTSAELTAYKTSLRAFDASRPIQEFFDYIAINYCGTADASGKFYIKSGLVLAGNREPAGMQQLATSNIVGSLSLYTDSSIDTMLKIYNCSELNWAGRIFVKGSGSTGLSGRTCRIGVQISRSGRARFDGFHCEAFSHFGLDINDAVGNTSAMELGEVITRVCGSGSNAANSSLVSNYSQRNDYVNNSSPSLSRSHLKVDVLPPAENISGMYRAEYFARIAGETYRVLETDALNSIVSLHPVIAENTDLTGVITYVYGGGVNIRGSDAGIMGFNMIDAINCGIAVDMCSLYGPVIKRVISQNNGIGVCAGLRTNSAMVSYSIGALYSEGNFVDVYNNTSASSDGGYFIGAEYALDLAKVKGNMQVATFVKNGRILNFEKFANNQDIIGSKTRITFEYANQVKTYYKDGWEFDIAPVNSNINRLFGIDSMTLVMIGSGSNGTPTGSFKFNIPVGWTVNGSSTPVIFSNFSGGAVTFSLYCSMTTKDIKIGCSSEISRKVRNNTSLQNISANSTFTRTISMPGVEVGDFIQVAYTMPLNGLVLSAYVSADNTVLCDFTNTSANPVSLTSGELLIKTTKF